MCKNSLFLKVFTCNLVLLVHKLLGGEFILAGEVSFKYLIIKIEQKCNQWASRERYILVAVGVE
ncbi:hypothetical protein NL64_23280 [Pseudomonas fluorescens]|nr:hypothetical protein NL64_23280 [Pseudomonas fluorescens]